MEASNKDWSKYYQLTPNKIGNSKINTDKLTDKAEVIEEFTCAICFNLVLNPKMCNTCDKLFCEDCVNTCLKVDPRCVSCRKSFTQGKIPRGFKNILHSITVSCPNSSCEEKEMKYSEYINHIESCKFAIKEAKCLGCRKIIDTGVKFEEIEDHVKQCPQAKQLKFDSNGKMVSRQLKHPLSMIPLHIKVWEADQDLVSLAEKIKREIQPDGLMWKEEYKLTDIAFGVKKLEMACVVEDETIDVDDLIDLIQNKYEDEIQAVDIMCICRI